MAGYIGKSQGVVLTSTGTNTVESQDIIDGAVTTDKIAADAVTDAKLNSTKLDGIEAGADVTDATNVAAAGAVMTSDIGTTVLAPNGDGSNLTGINTDLVSDTTPQLGGDLDTNGNDITFGDNDKAIFGAGSDLQVYHDSATNHSIISESGTGSLQLRGAGIQLKNADNTKNYIAMTDGGDVDLYYNNAIKLSTTSTGVSVTGDLAVSGSIAGAGKVLQVVQSVYTPIYSTTASSGSLPVSATITPSSTSSKILVMSSLMLGNSSAGWCLAYMQRGSTTIGAGSGGVNGSVKNYSNAYVDGKFDNGAYFYLDSPSTTSPTTYQWKFRRDSGGTTYVNRTTYTQSNYVVSSSITLLEIAG